MAETKHLSKADLAKLLRNGQADRLLYIDLVGAAEAAELLGVERARIGKWRKNGILLGNGDRVAFPDPIRVVSTVAKVKKTGALDYMKLAASPLWWGDDIRGLAEKIAAGAYSD